MSRSFSWLFFAVTSELDEHKVYRYTILSHFQFHLHSFGRTAHCKAGQICRLCHEVYGWTKASLHQTWINITSKSLFYNNLQAIFSRLEIFWWFLNAHKISTVASFKCPLELTRSDSNTVHAMPTYEGILFSRTSCSCHQTAKAAKKVAERSSARRDVNQHARMSKKLKKQGVNQ